MSAVRRFATLLQQTLTPFLAWIGELKKPETLRLDVMAGITVALVLVPQSMAYAQLAGLPVYYGLYASFLPPMIAALMGSSRQLATGPVAVVSLMTAAALGPMTIGNPDAYLAYAVLLAFMVGAFQLFLGVFKLGVLVDFLSHPVVLGFTNAGALIIATSQLGKLFGVSVEKSAHHYETVMDTVMAAVQNPYSDLRDGPFGLRHYGYFKAEFPELSCRANRSGGDDLAVLGSRFRGGGWSGSRQHSRRFAEHSIARIRF